MGLPVTVYRWDDAGAPQFTTGIKPSEYIDVFKKCLVTGYGSKAAAGWTIPFEDAANHQIVFRNSTLEGSGAFVKFWAKGGAANTVKDVMFMQYAPYLISINPDWVTTNAVGYRSAFGGQSTYTANRWIIFATSASFIFFTFSDNGQYGSKVNLGTNHYPAFFCGDLESSIPNDATRFTIVAGANTSDFSLTNSPSWSDGLCYLTLNAKFGKMHQTNGTDFPKVMKVNMASQSYNTSPIPRTPSQGLQIVLFPIGVTTEYWAPNSTGVVYEDSQGVNTCESNLHPVFRGIVAGLYQSSFTGYTNESLLVTRVINDELHYLLPTTHNGSSNMWVNAVEWYK